MASPNSVDDYVASFPPDVAAILTALRQTVREAAPMATEAIKYGMAGFFIGRDHVIYLAGWKRHAGLYPVYTQAADLETAIAPLRAAKDTLQLLYDRPIPHDLVRCIIAARVAQLTGSA